MYVGHFWGFNTQFDLAMAQCVLCDVRNMGETLKSGVMYDIA